MLKLQSHAVIDIAHAIYEHKELLGISNEINKKTTKNDNS